MRYEALNQFGKSQKITENYGNKIFSLPCKYEKDILELLAIYYFVTNKTMAPLLKIDYIYYFVIYKTQLNYD